MSDKPHTPRPMEGRLLSDWLRLERILTSGGEILFEHDGEMWKILEVTPASIPMRRKADTE